MKYDELISKLYERAPWCPDTEAKLMAEAANAIADLIFALKASNDVIVNNKPKWIPVAERLPELRMWESGSLASSNVLFVTEDKTIHIGYVMEDFHIDDNGCLKIDRWFMQGGYRIENVTHWMPLPEPPADSDVMYYPQVDGITPTVIKTKAEDGT